MINENISPASLLLGKSKEHLVAFFRQPSVKKLVPVLVPSALAAALFPIFGPAVAGVAAVFAVRNGLSLLGISFSEDTIKKLLKPLEGQALDESDMQGVLQETLEKLIVEDKQVNEEAAKALIVVTPTVKEAALTNPKLDTQWLGTSLKDNLKLQGEKMAEIASDVYALVQKNDAELEADKQRILRDWSRIAVEVVATNESNISDIESSVGSMGGIIGHRVTADNKSTIKNVKMNSKID